MNKKLIKALSIFIIAGAIGTGAAIGLVGCSPKEDDTGKQEQTDSVTKVTAQASKTKATVGEEVTLTATVEGTGTFSQDVTWAVTSGNGEIKNGNKLTATAAGKVKVQATSVTDTTKKSTEIEVEFEAAQGLVVPQGVNGIILEGVTAETINLSTTKTSHDINKDAITAYFATNATKGDAIPKANIELKLYKNGTEEVAVWTGLKEDADYVVVATLINAKTAAGTAAELEGEVTVKVANPLTTVALKTGTVEFKQGTTASTTDWVFEGTRANGDKETLTGVTVGKIDTVNAGKQNVSLSYNGVNGTVECTITADTSMVTQSYAINISSLENETISADKVIDTASGVSVVATSSKAVTVEANGKTYENKTFTKRLKLAGDANAVVIPNVNKPVAGATAETTVKTKVTIYAISGNSTNKRFISFTKGADTNPNIDQAVLLAGDTVTKCEFLLTEEGDYKFATFKADKFTGHPDLAQAGSNGGINFYYIQVDKMISNAPSGVDNIPLGGTKEYVDLELNTEAVKKVYKVGEDLDKTGLTAKAIASNSVTAESESTDVNLSDLTFSGYDANKLGEQTVTVSYTPASGSALTATYTVTVESAVTGISGIKASDNLATKQVDTASGTIAFAKDNVVIALVGENAEASVTAYSVKVDGTALTGSVNLEVATHTIEVTATVTAGQASATLTDTFEIEISVKADASSLENVIVNSDIVSKLATSITAETTVVDNANGKIFITADTTNTVAVDANNKSTDGKKFTHRIKLGGEGTTGYRTLGIKVEAGATIVIYAMSSTSSAARDLIFLNSAGAAATATATLDGAAMGQLDGSSLHKITYTVTEAGTYFFGAASGGVNIYGVEILYKAA